MKTQTKRRVTLSLAPDIIQALDEKAEAQGGSRDAVLAHVLTDWRDREERQKRETEDLEAATAAYYAAQSESERAEDEEWATFAAHAAAQVPPGA